MSEYILKRWQSKVTGATLTPKKEPKPIKPISDKRKAQLEAEKAERGDEATAKQKWFDERRKEMIGYCVCGCGQKSSKDDDANFRSSIAHVLPQRLFPSVQYHKVNWIELNFWDGCHSNFDNLSMDRWVNMECWDLIKTKFKFLSVLLTQEEKAHKFYSQLEKLVNEH